jgi:predicted TIM-barrel fold metal-dependent hydrolase
MTRLAKREQRPGPVIDVQAHVVPRVYLERLVGRSGFPRVERDADADRWWICSGPGLRTPVTRAMIDLQTRLADMDVAGIDVQLLSTTLPGVEMFQDAAFGVELARSTNDELAALVGSAPDRLLGMAALPLQDPAAARAELERAHTRLGLIAAALYTNVGGRMLDDPALELDALFELAEVLDVPLFLHPTYPVVAPYVEDGNLIPIVGFMLDTTLATTRLIFSGLLGRHPRLKLVVHHLAATLPFLIKRIDYESGRMPNGWARVGEAPSEALRRLWVDAVNPDPAAIRLTRDLLGLDRMVFGTDHPFWDPKDAMRTALSLEWPPDELLALLGGNAARLLKLDPVTA